MDTVESHRGAAADRLHRMPVRLSCTRLAVVMCPCVAACVTYAALAVFGPFPRPTVIPLWFAAVAGLNAALAVGSALAALSMPGYLSYRVAISATAAVLGLTLYTVIVFGTLSARLG